MARLLALRNIFIAWAQRRMKRDASLIQGTLRSRGLAALLAFGASLLPWQAWAQSCPPANIWVNTDNRLYQFTPTGTQVSQSTNTLAQEYGDIAWNSSGTVLYGINFNPLSQNGPRIYVINPVSGNEVSNVLTSGPALGNANFNALAALPNGNLLAGRQGSRILYEINPATGVSTFYTVGGTQVQLPSGWNTSGDFLVLDNGDILVAADVIGSGGPSSLFRISGSNVVRVGQLPNTANWAVGMALSGDSLYYADGSGSANDVWRIPVASIPTTASTAILPATSAFGTPGPLFGATSVQDASQCNNATIKIAKISNGGVGTFNYALTNVIVPPAASETLNTVASGVRVDSTVVHQVAALGQNVTITETPASGFQLAQASCTDTNAANTGNPSSFGTLSGNTLTIPGANLPAGANSGADVTCIFTNAKQPVLRLRKSLQNGRFAATDQFTLNIAGTGGPVSVTTTGSSNAPTETATLNPAAIGSAYTFSEAGASGANLANYITTWNCSNASSVPGAQTPSGNGTSFSLTPAAGDDLTCTLINTRNPSANLNITKTNTIAAGTTDQTGDTVTRGSTVSYSIIVSNAGPDPANNAVLRDPEPIGLTCTSVSCSVTSGPATCPSGLTVAGLQSAAGIAIPTLPANSVLTFTLNCGVD